MNDLDLPTGSITLKKMIEFNQKNQGNLIEISKYTQEKKKDIKANAGDSESDKEEDNSDDYEDCSDSDSDDSN